MKTERWQRMTSTLSVPVSVGVGKEEGVGMGGTGGLSGEVHGRVSVGTIQAETIPDREESEPESKCYVIVPGNSGPI